MYKVLYTKKATGISYVHGEFLDIEDAKKMLKDTAYAYIRKNKYTQLEKASKKTKRFINKLNFEVFLSDRFFLELNDDDWEIFWVHTDDFSSLTSQILVNYINIKEIQKRRIVDLNAVARSHNLKTFYYKNWRDKFYTDEIEDSDPFGEMLPYNIMDSEKENPKYCKFSIIKSSVKNTSIDLFISNEIIDDVRLSFKGITENGLFFSLKYENSEIYGRNKNGFDFHEAQQLLSQWNFRVPNDSIDLIIAAAEKLENNIVPLHEIECLKKLIRG